MGVPTSSESVYKPWNCYLIQRLRIKCPNFLCQLTPAVDYSVTHRGNIEFNLRGRNITAKNFSLQMDKPADIRGDVTSSSTDIPPPLTSLRAMNSKHEPQAMRWSSCWRFFCLQMHCGGCPCICALLGGLATEWWRLHHGSAGGGCSSGIWPLP